MSLAAASWKDIATIGTALVGAILGVMNTWQAVNQRQVRLRVRPGFAISVPHGMTAISIEATNLSAFPLTISEVGFAPLLTWGKRPKRYVITEPMFSGGIDLPLRLEPRESITAYIGPANLSRDRIDFHRAYVRTSCDEIAFGASRALRQLRKS